VQELVLVCTDSPMHRAERMASRSLAVNARAMCDTVAMRVSMLLSEDERLDSQH
jgi:hypothetical protein